MMPWKRLSVSVWIDGLIKSIDEIRFKENTSQEE
jgi:hypothetical protein